MAQKRRSARIGAASNINTSSATKPSSSATPAMPSSSPIQILPQDAKLHLQADKLAQMTLWLHLRGLSNQADHLKCGIRDLVIQTEKNEDFRRENTAKMGEMMKEILCVQSQMTKLELGNDDIKGEWERYRREVAEAMDGFRKEVIDVRDAISRLSSQLDQLPRLDDTGDHSPARQQLTCRGVKTRAMVQRRAQAKGQILGQENTIQDKKCRIQEAINSTRRWNRDHKTTELSDAEFVARYLKQQSKRDRAMAVHLQRSLGRWKQRQNYYKHGRKRSKPKCIEEFCQGLTWKNVLEMVEEQLVINPSKTMQVLS